MAVRCSAKQVADFVVLWGMAGALPPRPKNADAARGLKSLDLILSTMDIFMEAFTYSFEEIYRKYIVDLDFTEEKFMEFLKPRCLLLTKDDKCFNFLLVCSFVSDMIHSFAYYNDCLHLTKATSKCLAATLKNRFKRIFETESGWEELISFCIKTHESVNTSKKKCELEGNSLQKQSAHGESAEINDYETEGGSSISMANKANTSFPNLAKKSTDMSVKNGDDDEDGCKETPANNDSTTEKTDACNLKIPNPTGALDAEYKGNITDETNARKRNEERFAADDLDKVTEETEASNYKIDTEKLGQMKDSKKDLTLSFGNSPKKMILGTEDVINLESTSTDALQPKGIYSPKEKSEDAENIAVKEAAERLQHLCTSEPAFADEMDALKHKSNDSSGNEESQNEAAVDDENNSREDILKVCGTELFYSALANLVQDITNPIIYDIDEGDAEKHDQKNVCSRNAILPIEDYLAIKEGTKCRKNLCSLEPTSTDATDALYSKGNDSFKHEESEDARNIVDKNNLKDGEKDYASDSGSASAIDTPLQLQKEYSSAKDELKSAVECFVKNNAGDCNKEIAADSSQLDVANMSMMKENINKSVDGAETLGQTTGCKKKSRDNLRDSNTEKAGKLKDSTNTSHTFPTGDKESFPRDEPEDKESSNCHVMSLNQIRSCITENPQHLSEIMDLLKRCEEDIEPNLFTPDEWDIFSDDLKEEDQEETDGTLESYRRSDVTPSELSIKSLVISQKMDVGKSIENIYCESDSSDDESLPKASGGETSGAMTNEEAFELAQRMFEHENNPRCSSCIGGVNKLFNNYVHKFNLRYSDVNFLTDAFNFGYFEESEKNFCGWGKNK